MSDFNMKLANTARSVLAEDGIITGLSRARSLRESITRELAGPRSNKATVRRLNFRDAGATTKLSIDPESIPTLVPAPIMQKWQEGDPSPYYKIQMIEYPVTANGLTYEQSFFESYLEKLKDRPIPGSKSGHALMNTTKPPTDFILVGGKIEKTGKGRGKVYLKNYIPRSGESGDNSVFIRENESGMIHFSLVSYPREIVENDANGITKIRIIESMFGERNDAVEYGTGAMKQLTNQTAVTIAQMATAGPAGRRVDRL